MSERPVPGTDTFLDHFTYRWQTVSLYVVCFVYVHMYEPMLRLSQGCTGTLVFGYPEQPGTQRVIFGIIYYRLTSTSSYDLFTSVCSRGQHPVRKYGKVTGTRVPGHTARYFLPRTNRYDLFKSVCSRRQHPVRKYVQVPGTRVPGHAAWYFWY